ICETECVVKKALDADQNIFNIETTLKTATGRTIPMLVSASLIKNTADRIIGYLYSFRDITSLKKAEEEARSLKQQIEFVLGATKTGIDIIDAEYNVRYVDPEWAKIYGDPTGKKCYEYFMERTEVCSDCGIPKALETKTNAITEEILVKEGNRPIQVITIPFQDEKGEWLVAEVNVDITERKHIEEDLRKAKEELEHKVIERTIELSRANEELEVRANELEQRNHGMSLMSEMGDLLQICADVEEAYLIISQYVQKLFPEDSGALYMFRASRNIVEEVSKWGENLNSQSMFTTDDCWSLRRGKMHVVENQEKGLVCRHVGSDTRAYLCLPMTAQGELMGILHLQSKEPLSEFKKRVALNAAEHFALTFSNLKLREILRNQAIRDPLTGLFNRRYMEETLDRELSRAIRNKAPVGVIMIDLDYFKRFNDEFGHDAGDTVLQELGNFLQKYIRKEDIACRYGGEEFAIILSGASLEITYQRADLLRENVKNLEVLYKNQKLPGITLSFGVAVFPAHGPTGEAVLIAADTALYRAKQEGRDRVVIA
ncbi:MAG: diguanylate cyclase, partial [Thermodesulfovibrionales bacterium]|nr:diguanylate cyclase [Thermodesulfovibrionales bacterium]